MTHYTCAHCHETVSAREAGRHHTAIGHVCENCLDEHFSLCEICDTYHYNADIVYLDDTDMCRDCRDEHYTRCYECGDWVAYDDAQEYDGDWYCSECMPDEVRPHSAKPDPNFLSLYNERHHLYIGTENEIYLPSKDARKRALATLSANLNASDDRVYFKEDSTIGGWGFEIVSHPMTLNYWLSIRGAVHDAFRDMLEDTDGQDDGLHVHISRRGMSMPHRMRFEAFIDACQDDIEVIARRRSNRWAQFGDKPKDGYDLAGKGQLNSDRYRAVNWQNYSTVELRIFRSTLNPIEFYAAIEFTHAAYRFTKQCTSLVRIARDPDGVWRDFLAYIRQDKRYEDLVTFLRTRYAEMKADALDLNEHLK